MKLLILGATGGIGLKTVRQAIDRGHAVTVFVRSPDRLEPFARRIAVQQGDLLNSTQLESAVAGHDAVLSGFGPRLPIAKSDANLLGNFAAVLTPTMQRAGVRRLVIVSTAFLFRDSILPPTYLFGRLFFPGVVRDATRMEQIVMSSNLDWTIVRPPQLTDKPYTGRYRVQAGHLPRFGFNISRANVADSLLRTAEDPSTTRKVLGVSN